MKIGKALKGKAALVVILLAALAVAALSGCSAPAGRPSGDTDNGGSGSGTDGNEVNLVLYFADSQAMYLAKEERTVQAAEGDTYEVLALEALIEGPKVEGHGKVIPDGTQLLSVEIKDSVAYVNFSKEFKDNHWGGSAGETMTIYSIVNTLTEAGNITGVKILVEGEEIETLAGHYDLTETFERNADLIASGN